MKMLAGGRDRRGGAGVGGCSYGWITDSSCGDVALQRCFPPNIDADLTAFRLRIVGAAVGIGLGPELFKIVIVAHDKLAFVSDGHGFAATLPNNTSVCEVV